MPILVRGNKDIQRKEKIRQNLCHQELRIHWYFSQHMTQQHYLHLSRYGSNLSVHQQTNGLRRCCVYIYTHSRILFIYKKEQNVSICSNMDGLGEHYSK